MAKFKFTDKSINSIDIIVIKIFFLFNNNNIIFNKNVKVIIKIMSHFRDNKIIIFKKKRRKGYKKKYSYRQNYTKLLVKNIKINKNGS